MDSLALPIDITVGTVGSGDPAPAIGRIDAILAHTPHTVTIGTAGTEGLDDFDLLVAFSDASESVLGPARQAGVPLLRVLDGGAVAEGPGAPRILEMLRSTDAYNAERVDGRRIRRVSREREAVLQAHLRSAGLEPDLLDPLASSLLPHYVRTRILADRYGLLHLGAGTAVYALSAAAITIVTLQALLFPAALFLIWIEVAFIAAVLLLLSAARILDWHRKWLDYRFLAERIRSAIFLCFVCIRCSVPGAHPGITLTHHADDWMSRAFEGLLDVRPLDYCSLAIPLEPLKQFLLSAWIDRQVDFYAATERHNRRCYELLLLAGEGFFIATLITAAAHASGAIHAGGALLAAATIVLPAVAATLSAIRTQREYRHNAERAAAMLRHLSSITLRIRRAERMGELCDLLEEANEVMLREQQEWRVVFRFRELEGV
ncbi:hypothetical protein [Methanofollis fontis]|uniref:SMODS and SLOG-associating 2TM effector domain-containing protein n=1 Tax=Methanofollis fontis TaxID=2052832 RepID=A0A483CLJ1_9EURY|nr:hypothetical protein [Methanofollis fontis]TAJ43676.1 hypothetical protein CUJ86_10060 [Methanofollis fontis]